MKKPIDKVRDGAASFDLNPSDDRSDIAGMISFADRLFIIKGKGIYEYKSADDIDPGRTNISVPNTAQRVLSVGADTPWVGSVILTAEKLFTKSRLVERINCDQALTLVFEIAQQIARMHEVRDEYVKAQSDAASSFDRTIRKDRAVILPTVANVPVRCKELLQKADHVQRDLLKLVNLFYGKGERGWEGLRSKIDGEPRTDQFAEFLADYVPFILTVRHARNAAEHPNDTMGVDVQDFTVDANRALHPPMIEVRHHKTPVPPMPVEHFMSQICEGFVSTAEMLMVFLCARHIHQEGAMLVQMMVLPEEHRRSGVRYCYGVMIGGQLVPMS